MGRSLAMLASVSIACAGAAAPSATAPGALEPPAVTVDAAPSSPPVDAAPVAVEVRITITPAGVTALAPQGPVAPELAAVAGCVVDAVPRVAAAPSDDPTFAYAGVAIDRADQAPAVRPALPELRVDFEAACSMFARSGAMDRPFEERWDVAQVYSRDHVRHPLLYRMAWEIARAGDWQRERSASR